LILFGKPIYRVVSDVLILSFFESYLISWEKWWQGSGDFKGGRFSHLGGIHDFCAKEK